MQSPEFYQSLCLETARCGEFSEDNSLTADSQR